MATTIELRGIRYTRKTSGTILKQRKYEPIHMIPLSSLENKTDEEKEIPYIYVGYFEEEPKKRWGFFFYGELPEDVCGKRFKLREVVNTQHEDRIIPDAQCLYVSGYEDGRKRRFFFSRRTGRSWEVL